MSNVVTTNAIESALIQGDLSKLTSEQRLSYYKQVCESVGLNPLTKPFEYMRLNGREVLYANKGCAEQLRDIHKISVKIIDKIKIEDVYIVTAEGLNKEGRTDSATGAVSIGGLKGDALANAMMKAETKAKRRLTLSICGLNMLDESEVETIRDVKVPEIKNVLEELKKEKEAVHDDPGLYVITFGKFKGKSLKEVDMFELDNYKNWVVESARTQGKEIKDQVKIFINTAEAYLSTLEVDTPLDGHSDLDKALK